MSSKPFLRLPDLLGLPHLASKRTSSRRGAFTVEFAFCAAIFFTILMAGIEFTRFMYARHSVDQAAYAGARLGIISGATSSDVRQIANRILQATGIRNATIAVIPEEIDHTTEKVEVNIRCNYADSSWIGPLFLSGAIIEARLTLDHENKAYLVTEKDPALGDNDDEPIDI